MFFSKKNKKSKIECAMCGSNVGEKYSFCPYCGNSLTNKEDDLREFGMLGKNDALAQDPLAGNLMPNLGITDKLIGSLVNSLMKNLSQQFKEADQDIDQPEIKAFPNGIRIKIGGMPIQTQSKKTKSAPKKEISDDQIRKMSSLPRTSAKSSIKRLSDKIIYELVTPGVSSTNDVFVSKVESGYEIKAIGDKKVYINNISINLPLKGYSILNNKLLVEFKSEEN